MGYNNKGLYNSYDKNHKERQAEDYYATSPMETANILRTIGMLKDDDNTILEPCFGGGHMISGIIDYLRENECYNTKIIGTDIKNRGYVPNNEYIELHTDVDVLSDDYGCDFPPIDYVIMNPPYSLIEPFTIRMLEIAKKGVLMLGRIQFLEGKGRYDNILASNPPSDIYIYIDRIKCYKNGDFDNKESSAQCYAWFYWDIKNPKDNPAIHWIHRVG